MLTCYTIFKEYCEIFDYGVLEMAVNGDETRDRVQKCALRLFRSKGYDNVTIDDICAAAEITRSAFIIISVQRKYSFIPCIKSPFRSTCASWQRFSTRTTAGPSFGICMKTDLTGLSISDRKYCQRSWPWRFPEKTRIFPGLGYVLHWHCKRDHRIGTKSGTFRNKGRKAVHNIRCKKCNAGNYAWLVLR